VVQNVTKQLQYSNILLYSKSAFNIPYVYDFITQLSSQQAEVIKNNENATVCNIGRGKAMHRKYKRLKLGGGQTTVHVTKLSLTMQGRKYTP
jgi:hypothetical protein